MNFQTLQRVLFIGLEELAELERKVLQFLSIQTTNIATSGLLSVMLAATLLRQVVYPCSASVLPLRSFICPY